MAPETMTERRTYVYHLEIHYPTGAFDPGFRPKLWSPEQPGDIFHWPQEKHYLDRGRAKGRANKLGLWGCDVTIHRSDPVTWPDELPERDPRPSAEPRRDPDPPPTRSYAMSDASRPVTDEGPAVAGPDPLGDNRRRYDQFVASVTNHTPDADKIEQIEQIRGAAKGLGYVIALTPASREQSLAYTALEEAVMWAVKGIVLPR